MKRFLFFLGRETVLSAAEVKAVFSRMGISIAIAQTPNRGHLIIDTPGEIDAQEMMDELGGIIKIAERIDTTGSVRESIYSHLMKVQADGKIVLSLNNKKLALETKKRVKSEGRNLRYIEPKNTATILHNNLVKKQGDLTIIGNSVFVTKAIQPIEEFGERDYGRPGRDSKSGMLPLKLARTMINLAEVQKGGTIYDPFCGSGTVIMEALLMGYAQVLGSDMSEKAVSDTKRNIDWLKKERGLATGEIEIFQHDATNQNPIIKNDSLDAIVTEPFLGKPLRGRESNKDLQDQKVQLETMYREALRTLSDKLKKGGRIVMIVPRFRHKGAWITLGLKDTFEEVGLRNDPESPYHYARPEQHVGREVWVLTKK